ncbi:MAG: biotin--[acetyl-CoA-carboxylase] ligase [Synergistaceae bacterium]|jgi:BirA family biotin operon repressor/biotin-[acetyl-CoA-carboxylase] ligase|nr:biotin--[acetyl-CoA-carboxylase] ligase [Synergistaceae bacterium]
MEISGQFKPIDWQGAKKFLRGPAAEYEINSTPETPSTQILAKEAARRGAPGGSVFVTDWQNSGRGRRDRSWQSLPGMDLTFSVITRRRVAAKDAPLLSLAASLAVCEALRKPLPESVSIKWPNDILAGERKICGIICECSGAEYIDYAVTGIGINVNSRPEDPAQEDKKSPAPTSLLAETGRTFGLPELLASVLGELDRAYALAETARGRAALLTSYRTRCGTIGRAVTIVTEDGNLDCVAVGISDDGAVVVQDADGKKRAFNAADVIHARLKGVI